MKPKPIPDRWLEYKACGDVVEGTRIICFKVPLRKHAQVNVPEVKELWDVPSILARIPRLSGVIDLTNTNRYYEPNDFLAANVMYKKIFMPGREIPPESKVTEFMDAIDEFLGRKCVAVQVRRTRRGLSTADSLVGVHCTHGLNRTGYMVCRYMRDRLNIPGKEALKRFEKARGYKIERDVYVKAILNENITFNQGKTSDHEPQKNENQIIGTISPAQINTQSSRVPNLATFYRTYNDSDNMRDYDVNNDDTYRISSNANRGKYNNDRGGYSSYRGGYGSNQDNHYSSRSGYNNIRDDPNSYRGRGGYSSNRGGSSSNRVGYNSDRGGYRSYRGSYNSDRFKIRSDLGGYSRDRRSNSSNRDSFGFNRGSYNNSSGHNSNRSGYNSNHDLYSGGRGSYKSGGLDNSNNSGYTENHGGNSSNRGSFFNDRYSNSGNRSAYNNDRDAYNVNKNSYGTSNNYNSNTENPYKRNKKDKEG